MDKERLEEIKSQLVEYVQDNKVPAMDNMVLLLGSILEALLSE